MLNYQISIFYGSEHWAISLQIKKRFVATEMWFRIMLIFVIVIIAVSLYGHIRKRGSTEVNCECFHGMPVKSTLNHDLVSHPVAM